MAWIMWTVNLVDVDFSKLAHVFKTECFSGWKFGNEVKIKCDIAANVTRLASSAGFRSCHGRE